MSTVRKYMLLVILSAVTWTNGIDVPIVMGHLVVDAATENTKPGVIVNGCAQSQVGNAGNSFVSDPADAVAEQRRRTFVYVVVGIGVSVVLGVLANVAYGVASVKKRLATDPEIQAVTECKLPSVNKLQNPATILEDLREIRITITEIKAEMRQGFRQQQPSDDVVRGPKPSEA